MEKACGPQHEVTCVSQGVAQVAHCRPYSTALRVKSPPPINTLSTVLYSVESAPPPHENTVHYALQRESAPPPSNTLLTSSVLWQSTCFEASTTLKSASPTPSESPTVPTVISPHDEAKHRRSPSRRSAWTGRFPDPPPAPMAKPPHEQTSWPLHIRAGEKKSQPKSRREEKSAQNPPSHPPISRLQLHPFSGFFCARVMIMVKKSLALGV